METIKQYNKRVMERYSEHELNKYKTGVKCDYCETEMLKTNPNMILTSFPPKIEIGCPTCDRTEYLIV